MHFDFNSINNSFFLKECRPNKLLLKNYLMKKETLIFELRNKHFIHFHVSYCQNGVESSTKYLRGNKILVQVLFICKCHGWVHNVRS